MSKLILNYILKMIKDRKDIFEKCTKKFMSDSKGLCYDTSANWFHFKRVGVSNHVYEFKQNYDESGGFIWKCMNCRQNKKSAAAKISKN